MTVPAISPHGGANPLRPLIEASIESLIALLDAIDGDPDLEDTDEDKAVDDDRCDLADSGDWEPDQNGLCTWPDDLEDQTTLPVTRTFAMCHKPDPHPEAETLIRRTCERTAGTGWLHTLLRSAATPINRDAVVYLTGPDGVLLRGWAP